MDIKTLKDRNFNPDTVEGEYNVVALWTSFRLRRIIAGMLAGIVAAFMMELFGVIFCALNGVDLTMPMRIAALPIIGRDALEIASATGMIVGVTAHAVLSMILGAVYAHFTGMNKIGALFGIGLTWAAWGWVFITCLFMPSFRAYHEAQIPAGLMFFAWIVFGLSLMSVAIFDRNAPTTVKPLNTNPNKT